MADKKITELPYIDTLSGSLVGDNTPLQNTVIPLVLRGNTNQINIENFSKFVTAYSAHTGSAGNIFTGPQTINNNVTINGRLTVREVVAEYETASILFSTGSTKLGDQITDKHEFTGSTNITGSFIVNGANLTDFSASNSTLFTNYSSSVSQSISSYSSSNSTTFTNLSSSNSTTFTNFSSSNAIISQTYSASNSTTFTNLSSSNSTTFTNYSSSVSQSISSYSSSNSTTFTNLSSSNSTTFTNYSSSTADSINGLSLGIGTELARVYQTTASLNVQTGSQNSLNTSLGLITSSIYGEITSFNSVFQRIGSTTSSMNTQSGSQDLVNLGISSVTGSLIGITNTLMAFTAALDNTYATDAQLYQLYQATSSIQFATRSLNIQTGSQDIVNFNISTYTGSQNVINSSVDSHILKQATQTGSQDLVNLGISSVTGSLIGITNGLMAFTSALDNTYATDAQLYQLYHATASLNTQTGSQDLVNLSISTYTGSQNVINSSVDAHILKQATQTGSQDLVNLGISSVTGSLIGITNGLMAFTAALDTTYATDAQLYQLYQATASIQFATASLNTQTGSQDIVNFNISVVTSSIDSHILKQATQTGSQDLVNLGISTFTGSLRSEVNGIEAYTASLKNAFTIDGNNDVYFTGKITTQEVHTTYTTSSVLFQSGSTKFGNSSDDIHEFTGSKFEVFNSNTSGTMYAVVKNNRARNAAVKTTTTNGSFIAGTSIGTDAFQYQIYDEVEGVNRVTINSQGGTTLQGAVSASQTLRVSGKTQIGTSTVDTSLGSNTKLSVVGDGSVNAGASQGSMFVGAGVTGGDTGLPLNMGTAGATMMLLASINTSTGTSTNSATYVLQFYFDGNNVPNVMFLTGSSNFVTFAATPSNTLAISGSSSGNKSYAWFINKFGA
jgi:hypothetical protein